MSATRAGQNMKDEKAVIVPLDHFSKPVLYSIDHQTVKNLSGVHARVKDDKEDKTIKRLVLKAPSNISKEQFDEAKTPHWT